MIDLATEFRQRGYLRSKDVVMMRTWVHDLNTIGYVFPKIVPSDHNCNICTKGSDGNCRRAHLELPHPHRIDNDLDRAIQKVDAFRALRAWCTEANYTKLDCSMISPPALANIHKNNVALRNNLNNVLIIIDNHPRLSGLGLLQRLYQPYFGIVLFCGTWNFLRYRDNVVKGR